MKHSKATLVTISVEFVLLVTLATGASLIFGYYEFRPFGMGVLVPALIYASVLPVGIAVCYHAFFLFKLARLSSENSDLSREATTDGLTKVLNKTAFRRAVEAEIRAMAFVPAEMRSNALVIVDADHFKRINDRLGHATGDIALITIARALRRSLRSSDIVGRIGGEEFAVFLRGAKTSEARMVAERLRKVVNQLQVGPAEAPARLSVSAGGVAFRQASAFDVLYRAADANLYRAKAAGRNRVEFSEIAPVRGHLQAEDAAERAILPAARGKLTTPAGAR